MKNIIKMLFLACRVFSLKFCNIKLSFTTLIVHESNLSKYWSFFPSLIVDANDRPHTACAKGQQYNQTSPLNMENYSYQEKISCKESNVTDGGPRRVSSRGSSVTMLVYKSLRKGATFSSNLGQRN